MQCNRSISMLSGTARSTEMINSVFVLLSASILTCAGLYYSRLTCVIPTITAGLSTPIRNCPNGASRSLMLNELVGTHRGQLFSANEDVVFLTGKHMVNGTPIPFLFANGVRNLRLRGQKDVTIVCKDDFFFNFDQVNGDLTVLNLQFENCTGNSGQYKTTLFVRTNSARVTFDNIRIMSEGGVGIVLFPEGSDSYIVNLRNSFLSTGGVGLHSEGYISIQNEHLGYHPTTELQVHNTTFHTSCLEFRTKYVSYIIRNTSFIECKCSPLLSFHGMTNVTLRNVRICENKSPYLMYADNTIVILEGYCVFCNNAGTLSLNSVSELILNNATAEFFDNHVLSKNGHPGTTLLVSKSNVFIKHSHVLFEGNYGEHCGGIIFINSVLLLSGESIANFVRNYGHKGGALSLYENSTLRLGTLDLNSPPITVKLSFVFNNAALGGAIYVEDRDYIDPFSHYLTSSIFVLKDFKGKVKLNFANNTASFGGNHMYGGWIDLNATKQSITYNANISDMIEFESDNDVSSDPTRICKCINNSPDCSVNEQTIEIFPGQTLNLEAVAVGQRYGTVKAFVTASLNHQVGPFINYRTQIGRIGDLENIQTVERSCTSLQYTILSPNKKERLVIRPFENENTPYLEPKLLEENPELALLFKPFSMTLHIKDCPLAFYFDKTSYECTCLPSLLLHNLNCSSQLLQILRSEQQWVGMTFVHTIPEENPGIISHQHCPLGYCRRDQESLSISMEFEHQQCTFNRYGILCGACQPNFSQIFGSLKCKECSNNLMVIAILPGVLLVGVALVIFLMLLNLTVSVGTINSLIFYANIIRAQHTTFFTPDISDSFFSKFIAWINLDLGIETCFYNGLDAYTKTWLQFLFPLYIWMLVTIIIISSHYSSLASRLSGRNAVQVLATLFLLSYTKILQIAITVFSSTTIVYPDGYIKSVWLYDGNVEFLGRKHAALFVVTTFLIVSFAVPYTLLLVTVQWLLKISHYRILFWVRRLKPLLDAYTGPYKINHRYWTGVLLIVRLIVLVIFSLIRENNPSINLLTITTISFALIVWLYFTKWVYTTRLNNILEVISLSNLCLTSTAIIFELSRNNRSPIVMYISSGVAFSLFIIIVLYHAQRQFGLTIARAVLKIKNLIPMKSQTVSKSHDLKLDKPQMEVTNTVVELSELLLEEEQKENYVND